jgi:hypothetical protein
VKILSSLGYGIDLKNQGGDELRGAIGANRLSREVSMFLINASRLEDDVLPRLSVSTALKREITIFLLGVCNHVSDRRLKSGSFLAKILDFKENQ